MVNLKKNPVALTKMPVHLMESPSKARLIPRLLGLLKRSHRWLKSLSSTVKMCLLMTPELTSTKTMKESSSASSDTTRCGGTRRCASVRRFKTGHSVSRPVIVLPFVRQSVLNSERRSGSVLSNAIWSTMRLLSDENVNAM